MEAKAVARLRKRGREETPGMVELVGGGGKWPRSEGQYVREPELTVKLCPSVSVCRTAEAVWESHDCSWG